MPDKPNSSNNSLDSDARRRMSETGDNPIVPVELSSKFLVRLRRDKYRRLAEKNKERNKLGASKRCLEKALYFSMNLDENDQLSIAMDLEALGTVLYMQGKHEAAQALMSRARRIKEIY